MKDDGAVAMKLELRHEKDAAKDRSDERLPSATRRSSRNRLRRGMSSPLWLAVYVVGALFHVETARATPASGFTGTTLANGTFTEFQVTNRLTQDQLQRLAPGFPGNTWSSLEKTEGPSDLYIQTNT